MLEKGGMKKKPRGLAYGKEIRQKKNCTGGGTNLEGIKKDSGPAIAEERVGTEKNNVGEGTKTATTAIKGMKTKFQKEETRRGHKGLQKDVFHQQRSIKKGGKKKKTHEKNGGPRVIRKREVEQRKPMVVDRLVDRKSQKPKL